MAATGYARASPCHGYGLGHGHGLGHGLIRQCVYVARRNYVHLRLAHTQVPIDTFALLVYLQDRFHTYIVVAQEHTRTTHTRRDSGAQSLENRGINIRDYSFHFHACEPYSFYQKNQRISKLIDSVLNDSLIKIRE